MTDKYPTYTVPTIPLCLIQPGMRVRISHPQIVERSEIGHGYVGNVTQIVNMGGAQDSAFQVEVALDEHLEELDEWGNKLAVFAYHCYTLSSLGFSNNSASRTAQYPLCLLEEPETFAAPIEAPHSHFQNKDFIDPDIMGEGYTYTEDELIRWYDAFLSETGLPPMSADELAAEAHTFSMNRAERHFLERFILLWERSQKTWTR